MRQASQLVVITGQDLIDINRAEMPMCRHIFVVVSLQTSALNLTNINDIDRERKRSHCVLLLQTTILRHSDYKEYKMTVIPNYEE